MTRAAISGRPRHGKAGRLVITADRGGGGAAWHFRRHAGQRNADDRASWRAESRRNRTTSPDAPSWPWNNVVHRVAAREAAYLRHYALVDLIA